MKVLLVEDNMTLGKELLDMLELYHYQVKWITCGHLAESYDADIYLIDIMLPDISGFDVCAKIREKTKNPIIILTALDEEKEILYGFQQGANDYVIKPFSFQILNMRIQSLLRLSQHDQHHLYCGELKIDIDNKAVYQNGTLLKIRKSEFEILMLLINNIGKICTRDYLMENMYHYEAVEEATLTVHISRLRKVIGKAYIETIYGYGYRWIKEIDSYD